MTNTSDIARLLTPAKYLPVNKNELEEVVDLLFHGILFPICNKHCKTERNILLASCVLYDNISTLLPEKETQDIVDNIIENLLQIQKDLYEDAENFLNNDPAAKSIEEVILTYPGFFALAVHRISHELYKLKVPIIPRLFSEYAHSKVGIDIHPGATIGKRFFIDHGTGIVIGETTVIGNNVKIYQGVTLGALSVSKSLNNTKRHPTIEDNVVIYAGSTILGGDTVIGNNTTIGGNVWLTQSVPPYSMVLHNPEIRIKDSRS